MKKIDIRDLVSEEKIDIKGNEIVLLEKNNLTDAEIYGKLNEQIDSYINAPAIEQNDAIISMKELKQILMYERSLLWDLMYPKNLDDFYDKDNLLEIIIKKIKKDYSYKLKRVEYSMVDGNITVNSYIRSRDNYIFPLPQSFLHLIFKRDICGELRIETDLTFNTPTLNIVEYKNEDNIHGNYRYKKKGYEDYINKILDYYVFYGDSLRGMHKNTKDYSVDIDLFRYFIDSNKVLLKDDRFNSIFYSFIKTEGILSNKFEKNYDKIVESVPVYKKSLDGFAAIALKRNEIKE